MLSDQESAQFKEEGYVVARGVVKSAALEALTNELDGWIEESRAQQGNYGQTMDNKARFDLEAGHSAEAPKLRRVANPVDISEAYQNALWHGPIVDLMSELLGPNVKFHHCKINIKLPGMGTRVEYHQDHPYDPHTNSSMATMLLLLDDMSEENGCLRVVPGSQREHHSHYRNGNFTGATAPELFEQFDRTSIPIIGEAGDVCVIDTWTVHGGGPNRSDKPRRLLICDYNAADAFPLTAPAVPSPHTGRIVCGEPTRFARLEAGIVEVPQPYEDDSFFGLQGQDAAKAS